MDNIVKLFILVLLVVSRSLSVAQSSNILVIGDSNGALEDGWVYQLGQLRPGDSIYNTSVSGNTIGFDNLGRTSLNTLKNVDQYLNEGKTNLGSMDKIVIMLGTNDCKAVFDDRLKEVPENLKTLIGKIKAHDMFKQNRPKIYVISPPPYAPDSQLIEKYHGGAEDIVWLHPRFKKIAKREKCVFIDTYSILLPRWGELSEDGIHLRPEGQRMIAEMIVKRWE